MSPAFAAERIFDPAVPFVKAPQAERAEVHVPQPIVDLVKADVLAAEDVTDVDPGVVPANAAVVADASHFVVGGILDRRHLLGKHARRRGEARRWRVLRQGLVRTLVVVLPPKRAEAALLRRERGTRGARGLAFERAMETLMPAVLLR